METSDFEKAGPEQTPSVQESFETLSERMEVLGGIVDEYEEEVVPVLHAYEKISLLHLSEKDGYEDSAKRKAFADLLAKLASFESHIKAIFDLFESKDGAAGLNNLFFLVKGVQERLIAAPDVRYDREAQIATYGGKENVPAGKGFDTFEQTQQTIVNFKGEMAGIKNVLQFMRPTKVRVG